MPRIPRRHECRELKEDYTTDYDQAERGCVQAVAPGEPGAVRDHHLYGGEVAQGGGRDGRVGRAAVAAEDKDRRETCSPMPAVDIGANIPIELRKPTTQPGSTTLKPGPEAIKGRKGLNICAPISTTGLAAMLVPIRRRNDGPAGVFFNYCPSVPCARR